MEIKIRNKKIGGNNPVFIVAEIGTNHNGKPRLALEMIEEAKQAGVDAVKFQIVNPDESYVKKSPSYRIFKKIQFDLCTLKKLKQEAEKSKLIFFATAGDLSSLDLLLQLRIPAIKISSGCMTNVLQLRSAAMAKLPIIISTGMSYLREVKEAVSELEKHGAKNIALLHCVSRYPAEYSDLNLNAIKTLQRTFNYPIGYSDHAPGNLAAFAAVAMGAKIIEKHFTLDRKSKGPEHRFSDNPGELHDLVVGIRSIEKMLGSYIKTPTREEKADRNKIRRYLVFNRNLSKGSRLTRDDIGIKRIIQGVGLLPKYFESTIGKETVVNVKRDMPITSNLIR